MYRPTHDPRLGSNEQFWERDARPEPGPVVGLTRERHTAHKVGRDVGDEAVRMPDVQVALRLVGPQPLAPEGRDPHAHEVRPELRQVRGKKAEPKRSDGPAFLRSAM